MFVTREHKLYVIVDLSAETPTTESTFELPGHTRSLVHYKSHLICN